MCIMCITYIPWSCNDVGIARIGEGMLGTIEAYCVFASLKKVRRPRSLQNWTITLDDKHGKLIKERYNLFMIMPRIEEFYSATATSTIKTDSNV